MNLAWILDTVTCTETRRDDLYSHPAAGRMLPLRPSHPMCHAGCRLPHLCWPPPVSSVSISLLLNLLSLVLQCWLCRLEASLRPPPCPTTSLAGSVLVTHRMWRDVVFCFIYFFFLSNPQTQGFHLWVPVAMATAHPASSSSSGAGASR